ncbi:uncharacterized protein (UPF0335 family) [Rhizobium cellulosilyticum]|uniref:Uncharacterized protein (UPF0335 family) n=1 Tax=Aliirhizobium cellulosilyticum TaxID=393664 RepID=A0A7W6TA49_9HYPH|nr:GapR family DNA-binding domain-containing protein [Rhizobium cellulosilyticum]MBB4347983.1 uncharacterized protein (UPF0335 family) [Rhizobium cellulosilyticum]MBB4409623.1 uncharacterized protein (UPF0335 family) [Rhizobium cellulosilyticum]MBB4444311.1 uncharacterized protein (UPF0335 family) [Rhizobium cellulosilyticum]
MTFEVARDQLKAIVERVERLELEIKDLNADKSDIYKEARANGFDVKAIKQVVSQRKLDTSEREEADLVFETYWNAVHGINLVHAHARENIEEFDAETGEVRDVNPRLIQQVVTGMQTETGRAALIAAVDIMIEREEAEEFQAKASGDNGATGQADEEAADSMTGDASRTSRGVDTPATNSPSDDDAIAAVKGKARLANVADVEPSSSAPIAPTEERTQAQSIDGNADANTGGDYVTASENAATHQAGVVSNAPATPGSILIEMDPPFPMRRSEFAHCFPELSNTAYDALANDIADHPIGIVEPIIRQGDVILDGFCRYNIARSLGLEYPVEEYAGDDALLDVIRWQRSSRDWTPQQEAKIAKALAAEVPARAEEIFAAFHIALNDIGEVVAA